MLLGLTLGGPQAAAQVKTPPDGGIPPATQPAAGMCAPPIPMMFPVALDRPAQPGRPFIGLLRYDEDWSFLKDPANRTELWDPLKYIALGKADWYLSLGGETRQRYEIYHNFPFALPSVPDDDNGYYLMRYMLHGDLHLGQSVRVFAQFKSAIALTSRSSRGPIRMTWTSTSCSSNHSQLGEAGPRSPCGPADKSLLWLWPSADDPRRAQ